MKYSIYYYIILIFLISCSNASEFQPGELIETEVNTTRTADYNETKNAYFGDLHIHSSWSFDAFVSNVRTSPDDAYRFGKGEAIPHVSGKDIQLKRPLDFMAVSDHAEYMGALIQMLDSEHPMSKISLAEKINNPDRETVIKAFRRLQFSIGTNWPFEELIQPERLQNTWQRMVEAADRHYAPGTFTTFPAYEWTSSPAVYLNWPQYAQNLHRNVIFKGGKVAGNVFSSFDSQNPEDLWKWMESQRAQGVELIAIPHNANISDGRMYALSTYEGDEMNLAYAQTRMRNEPVNEVVQIKGQSMAHPMLSPNDEFANFEVYEHTLGRGDPRVPTKISGGFVREALQNGLAIEQKLGENPFQFGFIGSSDGHNGASNQEEDNNVGKSGVKDITPEHRLADNKMGKRNRESSVGGMAGVWATENTREAIFEAFERKEVFATSGPRIKVRFFAAWEWDSLSIDSTGWEASAYRQGVPMGSILPSKAIQKAPVFLVSALKDSEGANLDRIQVIKGWVGADGQTHERIFDVVWSGDRQQNAAGVIPSVGNTVDTTKASYTNTIGAISLNTVWTDPEFDALVSSFYYLRVLEIPTPRWTTYEAVQIGVPLPKEVSPIIQERAWSSPIWYKP